MASEQVADADTPAEDIDTVIVYCSRLDYRKRLLLRLKRMLPRVKPGAPLVLWTTEALYGKTTVMVESLGFEIRDLQFYLTGTRLIPIALCRKPLGLENVAKNMLEYGTGGLNIDATRLPTGGKKWETPRGGFWKIEQKPSGTGVSKPNVPKMIDNPKGRWPSNFMYDGTKENRGLLTDQSSDASPFFHELHTDKEILDYLLRLTCMPAANVLCMVDKPSILSTIKTLLRMRKLAYHSYTGNPARSHRNGS
jgi:hypothetical protein